MKTRRIFPLLLAFILLLQPVRASSEEAEEVFDPEPWEAVETIASVEDVARSVGAAVLIERETGQCLYEHEAHRRLPPASVTKIMTMLLVCEALDGGTLSPEETVTCSAYACSMGGSQIYLRENEQMTVSDLLKSVAVASANDAAVALAERVAGSEGEFVRRMNEKAAALGMNDTVFSNCTGLPCEGEHLTSAWDIALMSRALLSHERIRQYTTIWTDSVRNGEFGLSNTNKLVRFYDGCTGLKTGFTQDAMYCLSASAMRDGTEYIAVILHAETSDVRFECAKLLLNHAFATYCTADAAPDSPLPPIPVHLGTADYLQPVLAGSTKLLLTRQQASGVRKSLTLPEMLEAPVEAGQTIGELRLTDPNGETLLTVPVLAPEAVPRLGFFRTLWYVLRVLIGA